MVIVEKMELVNSGGDGGNNVVFFFKWQKCVRHKRFDRLNSNIKICKMVLKMCGLILFQFPMGTYFLEMNMWCFY